MRIKGMILIAKIMSPETKKIKLNEYWKCEFIYENTKGVIAVLPFLTMEINPFISPI